VGRVCDVIGGRGGGRDLLAQAIGDRPDRLDEALEVGRRFAEIALGSQGESKN
jgi:alanyl-tRNA synthetase